MADFIQDLAKYRTVLSNQLKKKALPWNEECTKAVKQLKARTKTLPPLKIPSVGKRILQTDASDLFWGAVLLEEDKDGKRQICGYKSGAFQDSEKHYHSTYKEILAVKRGIEKFQFHLVGQHFFIEMDMSSFPKMIQFKQKMLPQAQLLRWANWFSQWKFDVKHIKGKDNFLPDFLSRTKRTIAAIFPVIGMITPMDLPEDLHRMLLKRTLKSRARDQLNSYLRIYARRYGFEKGPLLRLPFHPDYPYLTIIHLHYNHWFNWTAEITALIKCLTDQAIIGFVVNRQYLLRYLACGLIDNYPEEQLRAFRWLQSFKPTEWWQIQMRAHRYIMVLFTVGTRLTPRFTENGTIMEREIYCEVQGEYNGTQNLDRQFEHTRRCMCLLNGKNPDEVPAQLFNPDTADWHNAEVYSPDWTLELQRCLADFYESYNMDDRDRGHPKYRVNLEPYPY